MEKAENKNRQPQGHEQAERKSAEFDDNDSAAEKRIESAKDTALAFVGSERKEETAEKEEAKNCESFFHFRFEAEKTDILAIARGRV